MGVSTGGPIGQTGTTARREDVPDARGIHHRCGSHPGRQTRGRARRRASGRPRGPRPGCPVRAHRRRSGRGRGRDDGLSRQPRPQRGRRRPHLLARGRASRSGARHDDRPPVRIGATGRALRGDRRDGGGERPGGRRRRAEHVDDPDRLRPHRGRGTRVARPLLDVEGLGGPLRNPGGVTVPGRPDDCRQVGHRPRRDGALRPGVARAGADRDRRGPLRQRDRRLRRGHHRRRTPAGDELGEDGPVGPPRRGRHPHRGGGEPDLRRGRRDAHRLRPGGEGPRVDPAGPDPPSVGARRRSDLHAHRADPRDHLRPRAHRHVDRRLRPLRVQRGLRPGSARVDEGARRPPTTRSTSTAARSPSVTRSGARACD